MAAGLEFLLCFSLVSISDWAIWCKTNWFWCTNDWTVRPAIRHRQYRLFFHSDAATVNSWRQFVWRKNNGIYRLWWLWSNWNYRL